MSDSSIVAIQSLEPSDPESEEIIRSLNKELETHPSIAGAKDMGGGLWHCFAAMHWDEAAPVIGSLLREVHPNAEDHVRVLQP